MNINAKAESPSTTASERGEALFFSEEYALHSRIDRMFARLLLAEWGFAILCAFTLSPIAWRDITLSNSAHLIFAGIVGGLISLFPIYLVRNYPGRPLTRHSVAVAQASMSALLIHVTGGRIETHFHIFGSLAFLTFYRDWRVLLTATGVIIFDHIFRGLYFPASLYGIAAANSWRWLEHATWVFFEDIFLIYACLTSHREMRDICLRQGALELTNETVEKQVALRTSELAETHNQLDLIRLKSLESARLAALGEVAGGIAHEINNPLAVIATRSKHIERALQADPPRIDEALRFSGIIEITCARIATIVAGLRTFSRSGDHDNFETCDLLLIIRDTLGLCLEKFRAHGIEILYDAAARPVLFQGRSVQISQVILNILNNSFDAIADREERWIRLEVDEDKDWVILKLSDSGAGIPDSIIDKIMLPFFTTKTSGKGTGLGLSISKGIVDQHMGHIEVTNSDRHTEFIVTLPKNPDLSRPVPLQAKVASF